jgi:thiamine biosynthesis protein ThiI
LVQERFGATVDLEHPELTITVEVLPSAIFVSGAKRPGPGGLPVSISGRVLCLLSGGIDSPVAAYRMMQRGCRVDFVHFHGTPYTSRASLEKASELAARLMRFQLRANVWDVPFGEIQAEIVRHVQRSHRIVLYRRMMLRIAEAIARRGGGRALVTGESLGQVSSQTLPNMAVIEAATPMLVLRPLVGMDKSEIVAHAQRIGTFEISILPDEDCCTLFVPSHPTTRATFAEVEAAERALDVAALIERGLAVATRTHIVYVPATGRVEKGEGHVGGADTGAVGAS